MKIHSPYDFLFGFIICFLIAVFSFYVYQIFNDNYLRIDLFQNGRLYSTKKAHRIFSFTNEQINSNGKYYSSLTSLWVCYDYYSDNNKPYFVMEISEISQPKIYPKTKEEAIYFINCFSGKNNKKIVNSWFKK